MIADAPINSPTAIAETNGCPLKNGVVSQNNYRIKSILI
jgi:hypothetical protein